MTTQGKILITGATGFMGKNLSSALHKEGFYEVLEVNSATEKTELLQKVLEADFIVHLAGVNRPKEAKDFYEGNSGLTETITKALIGAHRKTPIIFISSIHANLETDYGKSKRLALRYISEYSQITTAPVYVFRLTNTFGKWARTNLHSVVATFCYNIAHDLDITVADRSIELNLIYIDDLIRAFINIIQGKPNTHITIEDGYHEFTKTYPRTLGYVADTLYSFKEKNMKPGDLIDDFDKKLYATYLSYKECSE